MSADIGSTPEQVEASLNTVFALSQRWWCILLLDEADIILQARDRMDLHRNAIVSGKVTSSSNILVEFNMSQYSCGSSNTTRAF